MTIRWGCLCFALLAFLPNVGCLTPFKQHDTLPPLTGGTTEGEKTPAKLPPTESAKVCLVTAQTLERSGNEQEAALQYEMARHHNPRLKNISRHLAVLYDRQGMFKQAVAEYEKALKETPRDANLLNNFGYCYYNKGKWKQAEDLYRKALAINGTHKAAWINLGLTLAQQQRYQEGMEAFQKAVGPAEAHCNLAFVLTTQGKREEAKAVYRKALEMDPEMRLAHVALKKLEESSNAPNGKMTKIASGGNAFGKAPTPPVMNHPSVAQTPFPAAMNSQFTGQTPFPTGMSGQMPMQLPEVEAIEQLSDLPPVYVP